MHCDKVANPKSRVTFNVDFMTRKHNTYRDDI